MKNIVKPFPNLASFILVNLFVGFLVTITFSNEFFENTWQMILIGSIWGGTISITQWLGHGYIGMKLDQKYDILKQTKKRMILGGILVAIYSVIAFAVVQVILMQLAYGNGISWVKYWLPKYWYIPVVISFLIAFLLSSITYLKNWKKSVLNQEKLKAENLTYKYESLKNQLNPHFLFNSFNVLSDLIHEDQDLAEKFVQKLSDLYRYVLESRNKELVSVKEEMEFIKSYSFLLTTRFEKKLDLIIEINPEENKFIVPMSIQLLIENAVKHNEVTKENPLKIEVTQNENFIIVSNKKSKIKTQAISNKIGLENLKQQYNYFTDKEVDITNSEEYFIVKIPILNSKQS